MKTAVLVDAHNLLWPLWYGARAVEPFAQALESLERRFGARPELALDSPGQGWRHEMSSAYKTNRKPKPAGSEAFIERCIAWAHGAGYPVWIAEGCEADDVLATLALFSLGPVVVVSGDGDLLQLSDERVTVLHRGHMQTAEARLGVAPALVTHLLALAGDPSDGVPGVPGVGEVQARELLAAHGTLEGVLRAAREGLVARKATARALSENADLARLCRRLVTLRQDAPVRRWAPAEGR